MQPLSPKRIFSPALLCAVLLPRFFTLGAGASDALERYNARLDEIARSYKLQFAEIRKSQRQIGSEKLDFRASQQQLEKLGRLRNVAIAEARLIYEREQKGLQQGESAEQPKLSREERQRQVMVARRKLFEDGQKGLWEKVAREEPKLAELWAARLQAVEAQHIAFRDGLPLREAQFLKLMSDRRQAIEGEQTAFWAELFATSKTTSPRPDTTAATENGSK